MKKIISSILNFITKKLFYIFRKSTYFRKIVDIICEQNANNVKIIKIKDQSLLFHEVNSITKYRIDTFFNKEPETLEWIDSFKKNSIFWDVGANIGLYSIYAAKFKDCQVNVFEPSVFNLELLAKNIFINSLSQQINILPIIVSDKQSIGLFNNSSISNGAALSTLLDSTTQNNEVTSECNYRMPVFTLDSTIKTFKLKKPNHLKIDVDGLEFNIIKGAKVILKDLDSLLIEVDLRKKNQEREIAKYLTKEGFYLKEDKHSDKYSITLNQIWYKNN